MRVLYKTNDNEGLIWTRIVTAAGRGQLKTQPLSRLRKYVEAYDIQVNGAIEKDDYIDHIIRARVCITNTQLASLVIVCV